MVGFLGGGGSFLSPTSSYIPPNREIIINSGSDFPAPAMDGKIYLQDRVQYKIGENIDTFNTLVLGPFTSIEGIDVDSGRIQYNGTDHAIEINDTTNVIDSLTIDCPNGADAIVFAGNGFLRLFDVEISECETALDMTSNGSAILLIRNLLMSQVVTAGAKFSGDWNICQLNIASSIQLSGCMFDLGTATFNSLGIDTASVFLVTSGASFICGIPNSGNINPGGLGRVSNCNITNIGGGTVLAGGLTETDARWRFSESPPITDTRPSALASFSNNLSETVISTISTPVKVNAVWTIGNTSQFTGDGSGTLTFVGDIGTVLPITYTINARVASGGTNDLLFYIAINGVIVPDSQTPIDPTSTKAQSASIIWEHKFQLNDTVELWVSNESGTTNVIATSSVARIN